MFSLTVDKSQPTAHIPLVLNGKYEYVARICPDTNRFMDFYPRKAKNMICHYCGAQKTIKNSHVVPDFIIRHAKANSVRQGFFHSWSRGPFKDYMITGPYLCQPCDNNVFGGWEGHFSQNVFLNPMAATQQWGLETSVRCIVSICYRYAIHSLVVDTNPSHQPIAILFRDLCKAALYTPTHVGQSLFVYPYVYRPIIARCDLRVGINQFLALCCGDRFRLPINGLPNRYLIQLPGMLFLFSEASLTGFRGYEHLSDLRLNTVLDPHLANSDILGLNADVLNDGVRQTMNHQTASKSWWRFWDPIDKHFHPNRMIYTARESDRSLKDWQNANCGG